MENTSNFTQDWFSLAEPIFKIVLEGYIGKPNLTFMEIGSFEGRSAIWMLDNILTGENSKIVCVDPFTGNAEYTSVGVDIINLKTRFLANLKPYVGRFRILHGESQRVLRTREFDESIDVLYIDGNHTASGALVDMCLGHYLLKSGGLMIIDDYMWNYNKLNPHETPKIAADAFMQCFKNDYTAINLTWKTLVLRKK